MTFYWNSGWSCLVYFTEQNRFSKKCQPFSIYFYIVNYAQYRKDFKAFSSLNPPKIVKALFKATPFVFICLSKLHIKIFITFPPNAFWSSPSLCENTQKAHFTQCWWLLFYHPSAKKSITKTTASGGIF